MSKLADEIRQFCSSHNLRLNRDLGQHYLIDEEKLSSIVESGNIQPDDHIVEIGPGIGVLTRELLERANAVTAIELDERIIPLLQKFVKSSKLQVEGKNIQPSTFNIIQGNALHTDFPDEPYKIIANIPYHITSPLLHKAFLESATSPTTLTLLIQKEVAEKICSKKDAGILTVLVRLFGTPTIVTDVPPSCFLPPPKVDSAVLHIDCYSEPIATPEVIEGIFKLTKLAFSQKRKMLRNTIGSLPEGMELLEKANIDPTRRPQALSIDEWKTLASCSLQ